MPEKQMGVAPMGRADSYAKRIGMAAQHQWQFVSRFRARSFGWRASQLAATRLKEAVSEIRKAGRKGRKALKPLKNPWG